MLEDGLQNLFNFEKLKKFIKLVSDEKINLMMA